MTRFGVILPQGWRRDLDHVEGATAQFETLLETAREVERLGFDSVWLYDHMQGLAGDSPGTVFECWTATAALARETRRVELGQTVTCVAYRNPALLAKMASTVDVASGGRVVVGLGAGWDESEYRAYGYRFPPQRERLEQLEEAAQVVLALWEEERASVEGRHFRVQEAENEPKGAGRRRIPLLIGGTGERVLLRLVARYADACNFTEHSDPAWHRHKLAVLRTHCEEVGRDYDAIERTASLNVFVAPTRAELERLTAPVSPEELAAGNAVGTPDQLVETFAALVDAGIQSFSLYFHEPAKLETMRLFAAEVLPQLRRG
jgi:F420-dependent oxidoreductase-like protein